jgi:c-di-GMP-binding flagellar brake protein YcgR
MPEPPPDLRRRFPRISSRHAVLVKPLTDEADEGFGTTRDVSLGGCSVVNPESIGLGAQVELFLAVKLQVVHVRGRVVYESPGASGGVELGIEFSQLAEDDRKILETLFVEEPDESG